MKLCWLYTASSSDGFWPERPEGLPIAEFGLQLRRRFAANLLFTPVEMGGRRSQLFLPQNGSLDAGLYGKQS